MRSCVKSSPYSPSFSKWLLMLKRKLIWKIPTFYIHRSVLTLEKGKHALSSNEQGLEYIVNEANFRLRFFHGGTWDRIMQIIMSAVLDIQYTLFRIIEVYYFWKWFIKSKMWRLYWKKCSQNVFFSAEFYSQAFFSKKKRFLLLWSNESLVQTLWNLQKKCFNNKLSTIDDELIFI